jgi:Ca-activated chloride channel family protein
MLRESSTAARNQRIIFLTDAGPTVGASTDAIRELTETAFDASNGLLGVTYCGIGLSFDVATCAELSRAHNVSITSISGSAELEETLAADFNYLVAPVAFDVNIGVSSADYAVSAVFGGDPDCMRGDSLMEFRTLWASAVGAKGVKGSALIIHLTERESESPRRAAVQVTVSFTPFGTQNGERNVQDYRLNDESTPLTEKAFALSVYYRTLRQLLPEANVRKTSFTPEEAATLAKLSAFLKSCSSEVTSCLASEIAMVGQLMERHTSPRAGVEAI